MIYPAAVDKPHVRVVAAEIERGGLYLITQRRPEAVLPLLWEFPGGKVEPGESDQDALQRELQEKIGAPVRVGGLSLNVTHEYDRYTLDLRVYSCELNGLEPTAKHVNEVRWVKPQDFKDYEFPGADQRTVDALIGED